MLELEEADLRRGEPCERCGTPTTNVRGFVYENRNAHAIYFASWSDCTPRRVKLAVVTGPWGDDELDALQRRRVGFDVVYDTDTPGVRVTDPRESPWDTIEGISGPMHSRKEALEQPDLEAILHI